MNKLDIDSAKSLAEICLSNKQKIFLCIGTSEHVWDSYGPMVGSLLQMNNLIVFGNMNFEVNSTNVEKVETDIKNLYPNGLIIAIDAAASKAKNKIGKISIYNYGIKPGEAFFKNLEKVGDYSILFGVDSADINNRLVSLPFNAALETYNVIKTALNL